MPPLTDELLNQVTWKIPNALVLVGSAHGDDSNAMTASWVTQVSMEPVTIGVAVENSALTHRLITESRRFSVNLWSAEDTRIFVKFSKPAVRADSTLNGRAVFTATTGAPIFEEALAWMDCELRHAHDFGTHTFFAGQVVAAAVNNADQRAAAVADTRMKYGGVKRGGH